MQAAVAPSPPSSYDAVFSGSATLLPMTLDAALMQASGLPIPPSAESFPRPALVAAVGDAASPVCGKVFKEGDIVFNCRNCQVDPTCVQCQECYEASDHEGHEVYFHRTQAGGCCDCGDVEAWAESGFCPKHSASKSNVLDPVAMLAPPLQAGARSPLFHAAVSFVATAVSELEASYVSTSVPPEAPPASPPPPDYHVVVHNDDIHTYDDVADLFESEAHMPRPLATAATETVDTAGSTVVFSGPFDDAAAIAAGLTNGGLSVSLQSDTLRSKLDNAVSVVNWLASLCELSDGFGRLIGIALTAGGQEVPARAPPSPKDPLNPAALTPIVDDASGPLPPFFPDLLSADPLLEKPLATALHALYMSVMKDIVYRPRFALAVTVAYPKLVEHFVAGRGTLENCLFEFGVHIFTVPSIVVRLMKHHDFLAVLLRAMRACLAAAGAPDAGSALNPTFHLIVHKRYAQIFRDMEYVCRVPGVALELLTTPALMEYVLDLVGFMHAMDPRSRKTGEHVEYESTAWMPAF